MAKNLLDYLPLYWQDSLEMQKIQNDNTLELQTLRTREKAIYNDCLILGASEARVLQWEKVLNITAAGSLDDRRAFVLSVLRGVGKLNEAKIKSIVNAFTGGDAIVTFSPSDIDVKVLPPHNGAVYRFPNIEKAIEPQKPAHLGLYVSRFYSTWGDVKEQFESWQDVNNSLTNWRAVYNHIVRE